MTHKFTENRSGLCASLLILFVLISWGGARLRAQQAGAKIEGTVHDAQGGIVPNAAVTATDIAHGASKTVHAGASGGYTIDGLAAGTYTVQAVSDGFSVSTRSGVSLGPEQTQGIDFTLQVGSVVEEVTVNAGIESLAARLAPSGGFIEERSAQSLVANTYIENFTSPIADFGELVQVVPGAFTTSTDGVGLGQSKTYFRGFQDGDYDIDFDGIPFYDTNTPTHHSWAFFPSQWVGGVDFDRSPGSAATIGPAPFGGSIHLLPKPLGGEQDVRGSGSYGTWNTQLYDGAYNTGNFGWFGGPHRSNAFLDVHHMTSDGYQSFNFNTRDAGSIFYQYTISPKTILTGFAGVVHLTANTPNISSTRCMLYGAPANGSYSCAASNTANGLAPFTGAGVKFLLTNNADPVSWFDYRYNYYQVPTDFEYVGLKSELGHGWFLDVKPYTYDYDNGEKYSNATPITESTTVNGVNTYDGVKIAPCDVQVVKKGIAALPCGIDKYNSYRKYGETLVATQTSRVGVIRAGMWYEWARTDRHQYPSDPLNNWTDQPLSKFNEQFWTNSYQPYAEFEWHALPKLNVTPGVKLAEYTIKVLHHADDGSTVGLLTCTNGTAACPATIRDHGSFAAWLPSLDFNYRLLPNLSVYAQGATGSVVPPSAVYDYNQTAASASAAIPQLATPPKQQRSTTYQIGSVYKANRFTLDADAYRIRFQNSYSSTVDNIAGDVDQGDTIFYLQPSSISKGIEFETNVIIKSGLTLYLNGTAGNAYYAGALNAGTQAAPYLQQAPSGLWVAQTPTDTEMEGLTYQSKGFDLGFFNKRIGGERVDAGQYHNQAIIPEFSTVDGYFNYTIRNHSLFDQTKIRLTGTNLLDSHDVQSLSLAGAPTAPLIAGTTMTDQFVARTPINGSDTPSLMAGRSFSISVTFGFAPKAER